MEMADNPTSTRYQYVLYIGQINSFSRKVFCKVWVLMFNQLRALSMMIKTSFNSFSLSVGHFIYSINFLSRWRGLPKILICG